MWSSRTPLLLSFVLYLLSTTPTPATTAKASRRSSNPCSPVDIPYTGDAIPAKLSALLNDKANAFDGPTSITGKATSTKNKVPSISDLKYYNYYCAAVDCAVGLSDLACCPCKKFKSDVTSHEIIEDKIIDTLAMVTSSNKRKEIAVTFRGSRSPQNIVQDFTFVDVKVPEVKNAKVHKGFLWATDSLYPKVIKSVSALLKKHKGFKVVITGHSLGAAMATLTAMKAMTQKDLPTGTKVALYALGAPRVGNVGFVDYMNGLGIEAAVVGANDDLALHIPPVDTKSTTDNYLRILPEIWINGETTVTCKTDKYEDPDCSNSKGPAYNSKDHIQYWEVTYLVCFNSSQAFIDGTILGTGNTVTKLLDTVNTKSSSKGQVKGKIVKKNKG